MKKTYRISLAKNGLKKKLEVLITQKKSFFLSKFALTGQLWTCAAAKPIAEDKF